MDWGEVVCGNVVIHLSAWMLPVCGNRWVAGLFSQPSYLHIRVEGIEVILSCKICSCVEPDSVTSWLKLSWHQQLWTPPIQICNPACRGHSNHHIHAQKTLPLCYHTWVLITESYGYSCSWSSHSSVQYMRGNGRSGHPVKDPETFTVWYFAAKTHLRECGSRVCKWPVNTCKREAIGRCTYKVLIRLLRREKIWKFVQCHSVARAFQESGDGRRNGGWPNPRCAG